ncbi:MAG: hypothetical protein V7K67_23785 [Nostoc sp.]|uniref:hypothetical protein n=1 Tax=Nostoc sp. TaxID=1180 RepID=UPI002FF5E2C1
MSILPLFLHHYHRARDTFTGLKKTCRKLAYSFWQYLISRLKGDENIPYLPDVI